MESHQRWLDLLGTTLLAVLGVDVADVGGDQRQWVVHSVDPFST
jgi:hypothetical protein